MTAARQIRRRSISSFLTSGSIELKAAPALIGKIAHPLNKPRVDAATGPAV